MGCINWAAVPEAFPSEGKVAPKVTDEVSKHFYFKGK